MHKAKTHVEMRERLARGKAARPAAILLADLIRAVFSGDPGPVIIAVGGPGGTGKTTFSRNLSARLGDAAVLHLDHYKTPRKERVRSRLYGSHPDGNRMVLIRDHLKKIRNGQAFESPVYNDETGAADTGEIYRPARFNILDGEISVYREFRDRIDFTIFIDSDWKTQLNTRLFRDIQDRGFSREKVIEIFLQSNLRDFVQFGAEAKNWADVHVYCESDYRLMIESVSEALFTRFESLLSADLKPVDLSGLIVPILTPFDDRAGIDSEMFIWHLEFLARYGVRRILVCGTTGEFFSLISDERRVLLRLARSYFPGVILYLAGSENAAETRRHIQWAEEEGADGVLVLPHYYLSGLSGPSLSAYLREIVEAASLPVILYNFPKHTGNPLTPQILFDVPHFGIKDTSGTLDLLPHEPRYFVGADSLILDSHRGGGRGFFSARANVFPALYVEMETALLSDSNQTEAIQHRIRRLAETFGRGHEIPELKAVMPLMIPGYPGRTRPPLFSLTDTEGEALRKTLRELLVKDAGSPSFCS